MDNELQSVIQRFNLKAAAPEVIQDEDLYKLGEALFSNRLISGNKNISCADCHNPNKASIDGGLPLSLGQGQIFNKGQLPTQGDATILPRNTPALFNLGHAPVLFWDGRVALRQDPQNGELKLTTPIPLGPWQTKLNSALAAQALFPILSPEEMRGLPGQNTIGDIQDSELAWQKITDQVAANKAMKRLFEKAYPSEPPHIYMVGNALAEFQRVRFSSYGSAYDRYLEGDLVALNEEQKKGMNVFFNKADCGRCHNGPELTNYSFHAVGVPQWGPSGTTDDLGIGNAISLEAAKYRFRVPGLRNVALTAPYMHNGFFQTLKEVVTHYDHFPRSINHLSCPPTPTSYNSTLVCDTDRGRNRARLLQARNSMNMRLFLTPEEIHQVTEFLQALTDPRWSSMRN